ncbi:MAG: hypothetical protein ACXVA7_22110, partial [Isosphaeraceae bacterium]
MARLTLSPRLLLLLSAMICPLAEPSTARAQSSPGSASAAQDPSAPPVPASAEKGSASLPTPTTGTALTRPGVNRGTVLQLLSRANPMLWPLAACSIFTVGVALERLLA